MKRFWKTASLIETPSGQQLMLDAKPLRLPEGGTLIIGQQKLARAIREEWQNAGGAIGAEIHPGTALPLTQLHTTATHRVAQHREGTVAAIAAYGETDLLCYRTHAPAELRRRQDEAWQPWLDWAAITLDAPLLISESIIHIQQPLESIAALRAATAACTNHQLAALGVIVPVTGSLVLGLALIAGALTAAELFGVATVDEQYQTEFWGLDDEAAARTKNIAADITVAARFLELAA